MKNIIPADQEQERLHNLWSYQLMDTVGQKEFNALVDLAAQICDTPISLITLVDEHQQFHKASIGLEVKTIPRQHSFCAHAIHHPKKIMIVDDAAKDERFASNPLVTGDPNISFYAGVPLVNKSGHPLGALCVIDSRPRKLSKFQKKALRTLSKQVVRLFELRKVNRELDQTHELLETRKITIRELSAVISNEINLHFTRVDESVKQLLHRNKSKLDAESIDLIREIRKEAKTGTDYINELYAYFQEKDS